MTNKVSFPREKIKVLLVEGIHPAAADVFLDAGYRNIECLTRALSEDELVAALPGVHIIGLRSKTEVTARAVESATQLFAVGCFCIGTNQVALDRTRSAGIPVFNAPFSNTRSVAELAMAEIVMLARRATHKNSLLHAGVWDKSANSCFEVRNKVIGIVGYGHIGPQVGLLAEAFGMKVFFYDITPKLALGNATQLPTLDALLGMADFVTLHVPETAQTKGMIASEEIKRMKKGACLLNLSRGGVVDLNAVAAAIREGHLAGGAFDVFPVEPSSNQERFISPLCELPNVILTPHIGGSTEEAQRNIGIEVASKLVHYSDTGSSTGAVNFPEVELPLLKDSHRILNIHRNVPGVMRDITRIVAETGGNIQSQYLSTREDIGYLIMDVNQSLSAELKQGIESLPTNIKTRVLF